MATSDVAGKINGSNPIKNGSSVVLGMKAGLFTSYAPGNRLDKVIPVEGMESRWSARFEPLNTARSGYYNP